MFQMVQTLASNGANSIWEHSLLDPAQVQSGRRKPNPQDKVQWVSSLKPKYIEQKFHSIPHALLEETIVNAALDHNWYVQ